MTSPGDQHSRRSDENLEVRPGRLFPAVCSAYRELYRFSSTARGSNRFHRFSSLSQRENEGSPFDSRRKLLSLAICSIETIKEGNLTGDQSICLLIKRNKSFSISRNDSSRSIVNLNVSRCSNVSSFKDFIVGELMRYSNIFH